MPPPEAEAPPLPRQIALLRVDGAWVRGGILDLATEARAQRVVDTWVPRLLRMQADDARWKWAEKTNDTCYTSGVEHVMITHDDEVQGLMVTSLADKRPLLSSLQDLLYVEYLAAAPWNRPESGDGQQFKGLGTVLLRYAVERSTRAGRQGRIGLHSEPGAIGFYEGKRVALERRGKDPDQEDREYFEGSASWASQFLAGR